MEVAQAIVLAFTEYKQEQEQIQEVVLVQEEREEDVPLVDLEIKEKEEDAQEQPSVHLSEQVQMIEIAEVQDSVQEQNPGQALLKSIDSEEKPTQSPLDEPLPINYKVQIAASINKPIPRNNPLLFKVSDLVIKLEDNMYKYLTGEFQSMEDALTEKSKMLEQGFKGAFIVAYRGDQRVKY